MTRRGIHPEAIETVLGRLEQVGLIDDTAYAHALAESQHRSHGLARRAVAAKLRQRGLADEDVVGALAQIDSDSELEAARAFVARKMRSSARLEPEVATRRLSAALARRGFTADVVRRVLREAITEGDRQVGPGSVGGIRPRSSSQAASRALASDVLDSGEY